MRARFTELEFQVALMMGYYSYFAKSGYFNFHLPSQHEEKKKYAADWFYKDVNGVCMYFQFKNSDKIIQNRDLFKARREEGVQYDGKGLYGFNLYKNKENEYQQHNLLLSNGRKIGSLSCYIAPMFTSRGELMNNLRNWISNDPIIENFKTSAVDNELDFRKYGFGYFEQAMYIKPHIEITDNSIHHYYFNRQKELTFHSEIELVKNSAFKFPEILKEVEKILNNGKTTSLLDSADSQLYDIERYIKNSKRIEYRDYQLSKILDYEIIDNLFESVETIKKAKDTSLQKYICKVSELYKELFDIQPCFIYPNLA